MKHYIDANNQLWAFELDGSQDHLITESMQSLTDTQASAHRAAVAAARAAAHQASLTYAQKRAAEYPPMADYLDGVVKGDQAQIDAYLSACLAIKAKYPKPTS